MAETNCLIHPSKPPSPETQQNPSRSFSYFLYKAIFVCVLIALLPLFSSSQAPEFANKTFLSRSWELLHLLFVGIAISYGLFSRRNSDPEIEKETQLKPDTPQSYVSRILQVSSVFDDEEAESPPGLEFSDESKIQTWNSQYYRGDPVVMVAKESINGGKNSTKPLFLPVRSLKARPQNPGSSDSDDGIDGSHLVSDEMEEIGEIGEIRGKENVVLPSPIPWRSRSGRMEVKEESSPPRYSQPNSSFVAEMGPSKIPSFRSPTPHSASTTPSPSPSPKRLSPSPSLSPEIRAKTSEDFGRKKSFYIGSPPPAPPPPPPPFGHGSHLVSEKKDVRKSFKDELEDLSRKGREGFLQSNDLELNSLKSEKGSSVGRSVRTVRSKEVKSSPPLPRNRSEKKNEFMEKMIITSDNSDSDDDHSELSDVEEASNSVSVEAEPEENEVDKKADEFIAKFREQIRLQRIASLKKSSGQRSVRSPSSS